MSALAALFIGAGLAFASVGWMMRSRERFADIASVLDLPVSGKETPGRPRTDRNLKALFFEPGIRAVDAGLKRLNLSQHIAETLERGRVPLRPGEFVLTTVAVSLAVAIAAWLLSSSPVLGLVALPAVPFMAWRLLKYKVVKRRKAFESLLPDALTLVSSSLEAGHTFLHSMEMMVQESEAPLSEEFERVLAETRLGDPLIDALQRMSDRLEIADLAWVVQAIRIQQTIGGKLGELLSTLGDFMRAREEVRREVRVLTAEGRLSANVLGGLPLFMLAVLKYLNPSYIDPMFHGTGLLALGIAMVSVLIGVAFIKKMASVEV